MTSGPPSEHIPTTPVGASASDTSFDEVDRHLDATKPWVRLVSILGALLCGLKMSQLVVGPLAVGRLPIGTMAVSIQVIVVPITSIAFYFIPAVLLWKYGSRIGDYLQGQNALAFSEALSAQRAFWKYVGILVLVVLVLYVAAIFLAVLIGMAMSFR